MSIGTSEIDEGSTNNNEQWLNCIKRDRKRGEIEKLKERWKRLSFEHTKKERDW